MVSEIFIFTSGMNQGILNVGLTRDICLPQEDLVYTIDRFETDIEIEGFSMLIVDEKGKSVSDHTYFDVQNLNTQLGT